MARKKNISVTLREKLLKDGKKKSLYLDFYPPIPKKGGTTTRREYLSLYMYVGKRLTVQQKQENKQNKALAESIRAERQILINQQKYGFIDESTNIDFLEFIKTQIIPTKKLPNQRVTAQMVETLKEFANSEKVHIKRIDEPFGEAFKEFLIGKYSMGTARIYFVIFKHCVREAYKKEYLSKDFSIYWKGIPKDQKEMVYLEIEEVQKLSETEFDPTIKNPSLFACFTGLRLSDVKKLTWHNIVETDNGTQIRLKIQKTQDFEYFPLSDTAKQFISERQDDSVKVFKMPNDASLYYKIQIWVAQAGIDKKVSFHTFRHTYATMLLTKGVDITVVSKLLGHKDIKTTMIYAKVINKSKQEAVNTLNDIL